MEPRTLAAAMMLAACALSHGALAQQYAKPLRIIVPSSAGDPPDMMARLVSPKLAEQLGQPVIVENRPGATGQVGLAALRTSTPDGYTIGVGQGGTLVVAPATHRKLPYDVLKDFAPIALAATNYLAVFAHPGAPFKSAAEMVAWARANPGKLAVATNGEGGHPHLAIEQFAKLARFKFLHVPYKGVTQIASELTAGQIHAAITAYTPLAPHAEAGRIRLIGITNSARLADKPELPLLADVAPGYGMRGWFGFIAPAGTPRAIVQRLNEEINRALRSPDVSEKLAGAGMIVVTESPDFFQELIRSEYATYARLVREIGLQPR